MLLQSREHTKPATNTGNQSAESYQPPSMECDAEQQDNDACKQSCAIESGFFHGVMNMAQWLFSGNKIGVIAHPYRRISEQWLGCPNRFVNEVALLLRLLRGFLRGFRGFLRRCLLCCFLSCHGFSPFSLDSLTTR